MGSQRGTTLIEIVLVLSLLAILLRISFPLYQSQLSERRVDRVTQDIASLLRLAQQSAVGDSIDGCYRVQVRSTDAVVETSPRNPVTRACPWIGASITRTTDAFPAGVTVTATTVEFTSAGAVEGGSPSPIAIAAGGHTRTVSVQGQTGRVQVGP